MADSSIQLINSSAAVSADAFNRIDRAMSQSIEATQRSGEFAVGMTAKTADAIETARMHDATIMNMQANTYLQGEKLAMEKSLMPLRVATETLRFQAEQARFLKEKENADLKYMSDIFATYDDMMGRNILSSGNKNLAKDYLGYKAKWQSHLINGGKFDAGQFQGDLNKMVEHHKDGDGNPTEEWNPETQYLYESISPSLGKAYQLKNPVIQKNRNGMAVSTLTATDAGFSEFWKGFGNLYSAEESGLIGMGRSVYQSNEFNMDSLEKSNSRLQSNLSLMSDDDPRKESTKREIAENQAKIDRARRQNNLIMDNYSQGKYGVPTEEAPAQEPGQSKAILPKEQLVERKRDALGYSTQTSTDSEGENVIRKIQEVIVNPAAKGADNTNPENQYKGSGEFQFIDLSWFAKNRSKELPDDRTKLDIIKRIENGIDAVGKVGETVNKQNTDRLFEKLDKNKIIEMPVSDYTAELLGINASPQQMYGAGNVMPYQQEKPKQVVYFGGKGSKSQFSSYEDMTRKVNEKVKNPGDREEVLKELYAALGASAISQAITIQ